jgi:hypothetical protein
MGSESSTPAHSFAPEIQRGYKIVDRDLQAKNKYQYTVGHVCSTDGPLVIGQKGLHYCPRPSDCYSYAGAYRRPLRYLQVVPVGEFVTQSDKRATLSLYVEKELKVAEWLRLIQGEIDNKTSTYNDLLKAAAAEDSIATMELAIGRGADDFTGALFGAACSGHIGMAAVKFILPKTGWSYPELLNWAAGEGHLAMMEFIIKEAGDRYLDLNTALHWATEGAQVGTMKFLIECGATEFDQPLYIAATNCNADCVRMLLEAKATNVNTTLMGAARAGHAPVVRLLLEAKATNVNTSLVDAARAGYAPAVRLLLEAKATSANEALANAAYAGNAPVIRLLMCHGATDYVAALQAAERGGHTATLQAEIDLAKSHRAA